ncbi:MAG: hypothetical protein ACK5O7_01065 [Holosporales bacterium]
MPLMSFRFDKVIRHKMLSVMRASGAEVHTKVLDQEGYSLYLMKKLMEEAAEVAAVQNPEELREELADVLEVMHSIISHHGLSMESIEIERLKKREAKGSFSPESYVDYVTLAEDHPLTSYYLTRPHQYPKVA